MMAVSRTEEKWKGKMPKHWIQENSASGKWGGRSPNGEEWAAGRSERCEETWCVQNLGEQHLMCPSRGVSLHLGTRSLPSD